MKFYVEKDYGIFKQWFVDFKLIEPQYKVSLKIDPDKLQNGDEVKSVEWAFPKDYFTEYESTTTDSANDFEVIIEAWKSFEVSAEVEFDSGKKLQFKNVVEFE